MQSCQPPSATSEDGDGEKERGRSGLQGGEYIQTSMDEGVAEGVEARVVPRDDAGQDANKE